MPRRLAALRSLALAGYRVGLTIAPVMPVPDWQDGYGRLLDRVADAVRDVPALDLTAEIITHRFTPASKEVLLELVSPHPARDGRGRSAARSGPSSAG